MENDENDNDFEIPDSTIYSAIGTIVGLVAVTMMVVVSFIFPPEASSMDQVKSIASYIEFAGLYTTEITVFILLDTIFIIGYSSLFIGLWLLIRDFSEILSKLALILGLMVGFFDIVENTLLLITVNGLQAGWQPDEQIYGYIFILNMFIDILSYLAGLLFAIIFFAIFRPWERKFILALLLSIYVLIGLGSVILPSLLLVRSLFFIIGLSYGALVLWKEEDITLEDLEKMVDKQQSSSKGDFI